MRVENYNDRPWYLFNGHLESIIPYFTYKIYSVDYDRERLELPDGDFLDLDWLRHGSEKLIVISHAFEGNSRDYFVERAAKYFHDKGYDILMWHFRSCSREMNRLPRFYHIGDTDDLDAVISHGLNQGPYTKTFLLGYSMGAATVINYLGIGGYRNHANIAAAAAFSAPLDLKETANRLSKGLSWIYGYSFLKKWKRKINKKAVQFPELFDLNQVRSAKNLDELHAKLTIRLHGFESLKAYYDQHSSAQFLRTIKTPLLIVNAQNDPLLGANSYPPNHFQDVKLEYPKTGGHLGFSLLNKPYSWMELRAEAFFSLKITL